jgi:hypothetical protein
MGDPPALGSPIEAFMADRIENRPLLAKKSRSLLITRLSRLAAGMRRPFVLALAVPMMRYLET